MNNTATHPRERLIKTAATLVHQQGWTATGINQILSDAGIPKGSFYYYFRSKEALGIAVIQLHYANTKQLLDRTLCNAGLSPDTAVYELLKELSTRDQDSVYVNGCPLSSIASEVANQSQLLLAEANRTLALYENAWAQLISRGQKEGSISPTLDPIEHGKIASHILQGGLVGVRRLQNVEPLELAFASIYHSLFGKNFSQQQAKITEFPKLQALAS